MKKTVAKRLISSCPSVRYTKAPQYYTYSAYMADTENTVCCIRGTQGFRYLHILSYNKSQFPLNTLYLWSVFLMVLLHGVESFLRSWQFLTYSTESLYFIEPNYSLPYAQQPYHEPDQSRPRPPPKLLL